MVIIKAQIGLDHYTTHIQSATNAIVADEPIGDGGMDKGFAPAELLASSLGACTVITLRMYADRKEWPVTEIQVEVSFTNNANDKTSQFERKINIIGSLTPEQKERMLSIAKQCYIHKVLTNPITINTFIQ